jgi:hypothetical protein
MNTSDLPSKRERLPIKLYQEARRVVDGHRTRDGYEYCTLDVQRNLVVASTGSSTRANDMLQAGRSGRAQQNPELESHIAGAAARQEDF